MGKKIKKSIKLVWTELMRAPEEIKEEEIKKVVKKKPHHSHDERVIKHQLEVEEDKQKYHEEQRALIRNKIKDWLDESTSSWKETGRVDIDLEPPVTLKERFGKVWSSVKKKKDALKKLKKEKLPKVEKKIGEVVDTVQHKIKRTMHKKIETVEKDVRSDWKTIEKKTKTEKSSGSREEIENIYKQLGGK